MGYHDFQNFQQISNCRSFSYLRAVAVDLLQFVIKCQHPWLRTLRLTWIVADSYISAITWSPDLSANMKFSAKQKEFRP